MHHHAFLAPFAKGVDMGDDKLADVVCTAGKIGGLGLSQREAIAISPRAMIQLEKRLRVA
jgi:hypothetical protein